MKICNCICEDSSIKNSDKLTVHSIASLFGGIIYRVRCDNCLRIGPASDIKIGAIANWNEKIKNEEIENSSKK